MTDQKKQPYFAPQSQHQQPQQSIRPSLPYASSKQMQPQHLHSHHRYPPNSNFHPGADIHLEKSVSSAYGAQNQQNAQHEHVHGRDAAVPHNNSMHHSYSHIGQMQYNSRTHYYAHDKAYARMPHQGAYQYSSSSLNKKGANEGHMDQNYITNMQHRGSPSEMLDQQQAVRDNHFISGYHHHPMSRHPPENHNGHIKMPKSYDMPYSNAENHDQQQHFQQQFGHQSSSRTPMKYLNTHQPPFHPQQQMTMQTQQAIQQSQQAIPTQQAQHSYGLGRAYPPAQQLPMQQSNNHPNGMEDMLQMHGNNYGTGTLNDHQSKKRSYNHMMATSPSHELKKAIIPQQPLMSHTHAQIDHNNQCNYLEEQQQQEEGSETQSLDPNKDDQYDECPISAPELSANEQSPQIRSGPHNEPEQQSRQNEPSINIDHYPNNQRTEQMNNQNQRNKKSNQKSSKSPSPTDPANDIQTSFLNKNVIKPSKSKVSPPSRIKDNRSNLKEPALKTNNVKRSQTGLKKLKTDHSIVDHQRKSHSSDDDNQSKKQPDEASTKRKDPDGTASNNSAKNNNHLDKTSLKRSYYSKDPPQNSKMEVQNSPKKKGGIKQGTSSSGGQTSSRVNKTKQNSRPMDDENKKRSPAYQQMDEQSKQKVESDTDEQASMSGDESKIHQNKDQTKMFQITQNNTHSRFQNHKSKKNNDKAIVQPAQIVNNGHYQANMPVTSDQAIPRRNLSKILISPKPEMSDNSGQQDKIPQKKQTKPAAPVSLPVYQELRKSGDDREKFLNRKTVQNHKGNLNSNKMNKLNGKENTVKSDSSQNSERSKHRKDQKNQPGRQSERQKNIRNGIQHKRNIQSDSSDSSSPSSHHNQYKTRRTQAKAGANSTSRGQKVISNSPTRAANGDNNMADHTRGRMTRQALKGNPSPQSTQNHQGRSPQSTRGQSATKGQSAQQIKQSNRLVKNRSQKVSSLPAQKFQDKTNKSQVLKKSDQDIRKILKLYFEYVCSEMIPSRKIAEIQSGKFISKQTFEEEKQIVIKLQNICFNQYTQRQDKEMRALSSQRSNSMTKPSPLNRTSNVRKGNESKSYGKDFGIGDIIDLTQQKLKDKANLYLIYEIVVSLDFSGKGKTDKVDDELPDIDIKFKVHPIIQNYTMAAFPESEGAQEYIQTNIDDEYALDKNSLVCLFEIGNRNINDERLIFENFVMNFQQVQKSFQLIPNDCDQFQSKVRMCRHQNTLVNSTNYEKAYLIEYGYKYEDPTKIYTLKPNSSTTSNGKQMKSNSRSNGRKNQKSNEDQSQNQHQLNIKPYTRKKEATSSSSKISQKSKIKTAGQPQESDDSQQEDQLPTKNINSRQKTPIQAKKTSKSQRSLDADQIAQTKDMQHLPNRISTRNRNQIQDECSSPHAKNQSISSQNIRKKRQNPNVKEDDNRNKEKIEDMLNIITKRTNNAAPKQIIQRSASRRSQKPTQNQEKSNSRSRRYLNRDQNQKLDNQTNSASATRGGWELHGNIPSKNQTINALQLKNGKRRKQRCS